MSIVKTSVIGLFILSSFELHIFCSYFFEKKLSNPSRYHWQYILVATFSRWIYVNSNYCNSQEVCWTWHVCQFMMNRIVFSLRQKLFYIPKKKSLCSSICCLDCVTGTKLPVTKVAFWYAEMMTMLCVFLSYSSFCVSFPALAGLVHAESSHVTLFQRITAVNS